MGFFFNFQNNVDNKPSDELEDVEEVEAEEEDTSAQLECHVDNEDSLNLSIGEDEEKLLQYDVSGIFFCIPLTKSIILYFIIPGS